MPCVSQWDSPTNPFIMFVYLAKYQLILFALLLGHIGAELSDVRLCLRVVLARRTGLCAVCDCDRLLQHAHPAAAALVQPDQSLPGALAPHC